MCGIVGCIGEQEPGLIRRMTQKLVHRGPDSEGFFTNGNVAVGVRRLSIIDLPRGDQPIFDESNSMCVVFNGEIYNFRELKHELISRGHCFSTNCDTEVVLHAYKEYGREFPNHLRGMFAAAIVHNNKVLIARDRLGIKPVYYTILDEGRAVLFASEIKAFLSSERFHPHINCQMLCHRVALGYGFENETIFDEVLSVQPGQILELDWTGNEVQSRSSQYYDLALCPDESIDPELAETEFLFLLDDSVRRHLAADVEVGVTLSGGLDSTLITMSASRHAAGRLKTFTIGDSELREDIIQSRSIAELVGSTHREVFMDLDEYVAMIPQCTLAEERPVSLFGLPLFLLFAEVGKHMKVCLNGEGADELFGGYTEFLDRPFKIKHLKAGLEAAARTGVSVNDRVLSILETTCSASTPEEYLTALFHLNLADQLVKNHLETLDRYGMASGVEVRVPFLDNEMIEFANRMPLRFKVHRGVGVGKYIMRGAALKEFGRVTLDSVLRRKVGLPSAGMLLLSKFEEICEAEIPDNYAAKHTYKEFFRCQSKNEQRYSKREIMLFDLFCLIFLEYRGQVPEDFAMEEFIRETTGARISAALS